MDLLSQHFRIFDPSPPQKTSLSSRWESKLGSMILSAEKVDPAESLAFEPSSVGLDLSAAASVCRLSWARDAKVAVDSVKMASTYMKETRFSRVETSGGEKIYFHSLSWPLHYENINLLGNFLLKEQGGVLTGVCLPNKFRAKHLSYLEKGGGGRVFLCDPERSTILGYDASDLSLAAVTRQIPRCVLEILPDRDSLIVEGVEESDPELPHFLYRFDYDLDFLFGKKITPFISGTKIKNHPSGLIIAAVFDSRLELKIYDCAFSFLGSLRLPYQKGGVFREEREGGRIFLREKVSGAEGGALEIKIVPDCQ